MPCIVVLDDEPDICGLVRDVLEWEGYDALCLAHPAQVESALIDVEPDLFLIDLMLPATSGIDVARLLRAGRFTDVPMIAMSASVLKTHLAQHSGLFDDTIRKPFDLDTLLHAIGSCLPARPTRGREPAADRRQDVSGNAVPRVALGDAS